MDYEKIINKTKRKEFKQKYIGKKVSGIERKIENPDVSLQLEIAMYRKTRMELIKQKIDDENYNKRVRKITREMGAIPII